MASGMAARHPSGLAGQHPCGGWRWMPMATTRNTGHNSGTAHPRIIRSPPGPSRVVPCAGSGRGQQCRARSLRGTAQIPRAASIPLLRAAVAWRPRVQVAHRGTPRTEPARLCRGQTRRSPRGWSHATRRAASRPVTARAGAGLQYAAGLSGSLCQPAVSHRTAVVRAAGRDDWRHHRVPAGLGQHERGGSSGTASSGRLYAME